ncbi:MAG: bacillithiol biosynthesis deacetylase BshB1 [Planctomycetaceae bacterium]|nr:bacillithiol biosynthesis deacetylase BshB1 [Planctomycetaceae bacterium]
MTGIDLLAVMAHPDDAELAFGGLLARAAARGRTAAILDLTAGEAGTRGTAALRRDEACAAALRLGVCLRECLGWPDGNVVSVPRAAERLAEHLVRLEPALVLVHGHLDPHPDHRAAARWVRDALERTGRATPGLAGAAARSPGDPGLAPPDWVLQLSADERAAKWDAVRCHRSQLEPQGPADRGQHLPGGQNILERAQATAAHYGARGREGEPLWLAHAAGIDALRDLDLL